MKKWSKVLLASRADSEKAINMAKKVYEMLVSEGVETLIERELSWKLNMDKGVYIKCADVEAIIVIGGDGTILKVANDVKDKGIPILAINAGTIGFLSELDSNEMEKVLDILRGEYFLKECTRIKVSMKELPVKDQLIEKVEESIYPVSDALNEIAIITSVPSKVVNLVVKKDGNEILSGRGDGLIISTTTGSTAYSLSAGGPIVDPELDVFIITPLSPLNLIQRSIIVPTNSKIEVKVCEDGADALIAIDGRSYIHAPAGTILSLEKSEFTTKFIRLKGRRFYEKLKKRMSREL
ncbi:MAG: NAD(+)/NADH kinase [archaeon YNP-WB-040]|nr:NAD(+)/NADH kinase [Candidatus Culexarchaeum yellowstonense]